MIQETIEINLFFSSQQYSTFSKIFSNFSDQMAEVMATPWTLDSLIIKGTVWSINQRLDSVSKYVEESKIDFHFTREQLECLIIMVSHLKNNPAAFLFSVSETEMKEICNEVYHQLKKYNI